MQVEGTTLLHSSQVEKSAGYPLCNLEKKAEPEEDVTDADPPEARLPVFADRLSEALARARMSQKDLALKIGRSEGAVSRWIGEGRLPGVLMIRRIAEASRASVDWLLGLPDAPEPAVTVDPKALARLSKTAALLAEELRSLQEDLAEAPQSAKRVTRTKR